METEFTLSWHDGNTVVQEEVICGINDDLGEIISPGDETDDNNIIYSTEVCEEIVVEDGSAQDISEGENVMYLTEDNMLVMQSHSDGPFMECQVTEEVVTQDWSDCQELVIGSVEQVGDDSIIQQGEDDVMIPLPTDQDQYLASRPYPCDFCSRRFRKKANLMNHMVAHQTDRPHGCNLCGARYIRKCDLMNHLKIHAYVPNTEEQLDDGELLDNDYGDRQQLLDDDSDPLDRISRMGSANRNRQHLGKGGIAAGSASVSAIGKKRRKRMRDEFDDDMLMSNNVESGNRNQRTTYAEHQIMVDEEGNVITTTTTASAPNSSQMRNQQQLPTQHYPITDPRKPFVCQHCGVAFAREKALASHTRMHQGDSPFECGLCDEMFWDVHKMREHMRIKHGESDFNNISGHTSSGRQQTDDDEYSEDDKFGEFFCNECGESFNRSDQLKRHARIHMKDEDMLELEEYMHVCNVCGDSFAEPLDLLAHAECHARSDTPSCSVCSAAFNNQQDLAAHVATEHAATLPPNACLLCGRICRDKRSLIKHNLEHTREKAFMCPQCSKAFNNRARLKRHLLSHRDKAVTCDVCAQSFPDGRSLMNHRHSHSSVSGRQFPCEECGKSFGSRSSQQIHVRIHTGERPYGCRFCWKAFADGGTLRKHERIHTGEKPYACAVCPRAFNQRVVLREHIRSHHSGPDPNYSHTTTPYCCNVCSDMFATSQDLIVHLIHHCDLNTAMRRQPQIGPRKYKRRRKLKPHEMDIANDDDMHLLLDDYHQHRERQQFIEQHDQQPRPRHKSAILSGSAGKRGGGGGTSNLYDEQSQHQQPGSNDEGTESENEREQSSNIRNRKIISAGTRSIRKNSSTASIVAKVSDPLNTSLEEDQGFANDSVIGHGGDTMNSQQQQQPKTPKLKKRKEIIAAARPKMIHTQKTKISVETNEGGRIRHKTKTLVTRTQQQQQLDQSALDQRMRPRTKNVSYHILNSSENGKLPLATFPPEDDVTAQAVSSILDQNHQMRLETISADNIKQEEHVPVGGGGGGHDVEELQQQLGGSPPVKAVVNSSSNGRPALKSPMRNRLVVPKRMIDPDTKIVKIIKGGMIISKKKIIGGTANNKTGQTNAAATNNRNSGYVDEPQFIHVKQENTDNMNANSVHSPLSELAEISMQLQQSSVAGASSNANNSVYKCEMCSAVFAQRNSLLEHVPVHI